MNHTKVVLLEMRQAAETMNERSPIRKALEKWIPRLEEAAEADAGAVSSPPESPVAPRSGRTLPESTVSGVFDVQEAQERQVWFEGRKKLVRPRRQVERYSHRPWGSYPDLGGV